MDMDNILFVTFSHKTSITTNVKKFEFQFSHDQKNIVDIHAT